MKNILILGATSGIGEAVAYRFAKAGYALTLAARQPELLADMKKDLQIRFSCAVETVKFDALQFETHQSFYDSLQVKPDVVACVFGYLGNHEETRRNSGEALKTINSNYTGAVSILDIIANDFEKRKSGNIIGVSSVAGDR